MQELLEFRQLVQVLLERGADIDAIAHSGHSALHAAVAGGAVAVRLTSVLAARTNAAVEALALTAATNNTDIDVAGCATMGEKLVVRAGADTLASAKGMVKSRLPPPAATVSPASAAKKAWTAPSVSAECRVSAVCPATQALKAHKAKPATSVHPGRAARRASCSRAAIR